ncbi:MAG: 50S ribosomal protein L24 [Syntrophobacterales bacterium]|nr:MAG: 50S ribosomal protein L24 [Syntrophobacterales bacterium]
MHIKKNDTVKVISGREKGKTGKVLDVTKEKGRILIEKVNLVKRHQKPDAKGKGGIVEKEAPLQVSNVMLVCSKCKTGVRVGHKVLEDGKKVRVCKKCQELLDE